MNDKDLVLFTSSFPYDTITETTFVMAELPYLCKVFRRVIIVPEIALGKLYDLSEFPNVTIDTSRSASVDHRHPLCKLTSALHPSVISQALASFARTPFHKWPAAWSMAINRHRIGRNLHKIIRSHNIDCSKTVFYTFWFDHITEALAISLPRDKGTLVSGAHGHDMYHYPGTLKVEHFREIALERMSRLYIVSLEGADYMRSIYPRHASKIVTRTLGSIPPTGTTSAYAKRDGDPVTFVSCSRLYENRRKRVALNLDLLKHIANLNPSLNFRWIHIGDGPKMADLKAKLAKGLPDNLSVELRGALSNKDVHALYSSTAIDWFMLLSILEGGNPIALSEAMSYGIPVITCDVPGCREIADVTTGIILSAHPTAEEFASQISPYLKGQKDEAPLRKAALERWAEKYDASKLRNNFAHELAALIKC